MMEGAAEVDAEYWLPVLFDFSNVYVYVLVVDGDALGDRLARWEFDVVGDESSG
jgi:hypothetical protein